MYLSCKCKTILKNILIFQIASKKNFLIEKYLECFFIIHLGHVTDVSAARLYTINIVLTLTLIIVQYHQTSFTTNVKQTYIVKKYNRRKKMYKISPKQLENAIGKYISIITLNANGLNTPTKRHRLA